ncbi:MAG: AAA family ATPase [Bacteroidota bacterium]
MSTKKKKNGSKKSEQSPPVYFMDLVVENVRCFKDKQVLDLADDNKNPARWTIILGDNGVGKTTILEALASLEPLDFSISLDSKSITMPLGDGGFPKGYFRGIYRFNYQASDHSIRTSHFYSGRFNKGEIKNGYGYNHQQAFPTYFDVSALKIYGYGAKRRVNKATKITIEQSSNVATLFDENASLIDSESWLLEAEFIDQKTKGIRKRFSKVKEILITLLPDVGDFRVKPISSKNPEAAIQAKTHYGWVDMKELSLGYQTLIAWMVDLAARLFDRYPDSENPLAEPAVVLVDEIDLHLHPKWQRNLISHLTNIFSQTQFIVTAHSPLIVQSAEDANIVLLKREGDRVKIYNSKDEDVIKGWRVDQILTSDLFGLESTYSPEYDSTLRRREELLNKKKLTKKDERELEDIGKKLEELDLDLGKKHNDALKALQKAAAVLKSNR